MRAVNGVILPIVGQRALFHGQTVKVISVRVMPRDKVWIDMAVNHDMSILLRTSAKGLVALRKQGTFKYTGPRNDVATD